MNWEPLVNLLSPSCVFERAFCPAFLQMNTLISLPQHELNTLNFVKMHGVGNDFVVLDLVRRPLPSHFDFAAFAEMVCDRHLGVGGDGLLSLERATDNQSAVRMRMWNPDGTEDMCGNGLRCIAHLAHVRGDVGSEFTVQTLSGPRLVHILGSDRIRVSMGVPHFSPALVPIDRSEPLIEGSIELDGQVFRSATSMSTGSTHTVIFSETPVSDAFFREWSPRLEVAPLFPERTSIMWAHPLEDNHFGIRIWERGAGETLACGTGACAVAVAARTTERASGTVKVRSKGGTLEIDWDEESGEIWKTGPAQIVFEGVWHPSNLGEF